MVRLPFIIEKDPHCNMIFEPIKATEFQLSDFDRQVFKIRSHTKLFLKFNQPQSNNFDPDFNSKT